MIAGVKIIKVASHSVTNGPLLMELAKRKTPVIVSLGGTTENERDEAIKILKDNPMVLMHCVSAYPTPDNMVKLDTIIKLKNKYKMPVGFSSHEKGIDISVAAALLGACIIERHFTLNTATVGLDHGISLEPNEFSELAKKVHRMHNIRGSVEDIQESEYATKHSYHVAICASRDIKKGEKITEELLEFKQPLINATAFFTGMEANRILGSTALIDLKRDKAIRRDAVSSINHI